MSQTTFVIVWDTELITPDEYAELIVALGDLVRAHGGQGIERIELHDTDAKEQTP